MEKGPRSFEAEERFEGEPIVDEAEKDSEDQKLQLFKQQLDIGLDFYCQISGEKKEEADIHPEQKLFFSCLDGNAHYKRKKTVPVPVLTEYGLLVGNNLYDFKSVYREQVLRFEAEQMMRDSNDTDDFYTNLKSYRSDFREKYIEEAKESFVKKAREPFLLEKKKIEDDVNSRYLQRTATSIGAEIIKGRYPEISSEDALLVYKTTETYRSRMNYLISEKQAKKNNTEESKQRDLEKAIEAEEEKFRKFKKQYNVNDLDANEVILTTANQYKEEKHRFITNGFMTEEEYREFGDSKQSMREFISPIRDNKELATGEKEEIIKAYLMLQESIKVDLGDKYEKEHGTEFDYPANKKIFYSQKQAKHDSAVQIKKAKESGLFKSFDYFELDEEEIPLAVPSIEESRKKLEETLEKYCKNKDPFGNIDKTINHTRRHFELAEKYRCGEVKFGPTPECARRYISRKKSEINKRMYEETEPRAYQLAEKSADAVSKKLAAYISGTDKAEDIVFTPAGCFIRQRNGSFETKPISPFDKRITAALNEDETRAWENTWENIREKNIESIEHAGQDDFVNFVNQQFREMASAFPEEIEGESFKQLQQLRKNLGFDMNGLFGDKSKMNHLPTSREIQILGEVMPGITNFITKINFNAAKADGHHKMDLNGLLSNLRASISGGGGYSALSADMTDLVSIENGRATLNFSSYQAILHDADYDHEKARSVLYSCLGYELLATMSDEKIKEFAGLLRERANISSQSIFRTYGVKVVNPLERRRIAIKTYFVSEFNKFAHGVADDEFSKYFNSLASGEY